MPKLNFYLRVRSGKDTHPIQGRISHQGKNKPLTTNFRSSIKGWDKKSGNVLNDPKIREILFSLKDYVEFDVTPEYKKKNCTQMEPDIDYVLERTKEKLNPDLIEKDAVTVIVPDMERDFADYMEQFADANKENYREDTLNTYTYCAKYLRYFAHINNLPLSPEDLDNLFFAKFVGFLTSHEITKGTSFIFKGKEYTFDNGKTNMINTTVEKYYNKISSTIKFFDFDDVIKIKKKKVMGGIIIASPDISEMPFLDYTELMEVYNFDCSIYEEQRYSYEAAKDCFIFCAFTGLRHNELFDLTQNNVHIKSIPHPHATLTYTPEKNGVGKKKETVLPDICLRILERWSKRRIQVRTKPKGSEKYFYYPNAILPVKGTQKFNKCLHRLFKDLGWQQMKEAYGDEISIANYEHFDQIGFYSWEEKIRFSGKNKITSQVRKYDHITFHASRHSFAFWLLGNNVSLEDVSKLMNHESYDTTQKYYAHFRSHELTYKASMKIAESQGTLYKPMQYIA